MYGSSNPTRSSQDDARYGSDAPHYQLLPVGGVLHAVRPGVGAVAGLGGQSPAATMPHLHPGVGTPQGPSQQGPHLSGSDAAGTRTLDQSLLMPPSVLHTAPRPIMAKPPHPHSPLLVTPMHHTALPRARQLFGGATHVPIVQAGQPIPQQQVTVRQPALAWAQADEVLQLQQPTVQHMSPVQQRTIWQPPIAVAGSSSTMLPPHIHLQQELELQSQSLQIQLLHVQLQQQHLRQMQGLDVIVTGQYTAGLITPPPAAAASRNSSLASSSGGTCAGSAADVSAPARRKTRRGPNRGRSKSKKEVAEGSAGEQSGAQTSSAGGAASTASDTEDLQQQASHTAADSAQGLAVAGPASRQQTVAAGQRTPGEGVAKSKGGAGASQPLQPKEQIKTPDSKQAQDRRGSAVAAVSPPAASQSASTSSPAGELKQPAQRTTGLSHRQRYRRKQWELHRAMEQQRLQQQQQQEQVDAAHQDVQKQAKMLTKRLEGVSLSAEPGEQHVGRVLQQSSDGTPVVSAAQLAPPAQSTSKHGSTGSSSAALQQTLQLQDVTTVSAAVATGNLDQHIDEWLSKFLEL